MLLVLKEVIILLSPIGPTGPREKFCFAKTIRSAKLSSEIFTAILTLIAYSSCMGDQFNIALVFF